jgi:hypothetical protein
LSEAKYRGFNDFEIRDNITIIYLNRRNGSRLECIIDTEDLKKVNKEKMRWHVKKSEYSNTYYVRWTKYISVKNHKSVNEMIYIHQLIIPYNPLIHTLDHKDKNGLNNRKENLRLIDKIGNAQNRKGANCNNKTGCRNVCIIKGKYTVQLQIDGKNTVLGQFEELNKANVFAEKMRLKYYKKYIP